MPSLKDSVSSDVRVAITALAYGGAGIGEVVDGAHAGLKVFVPYTAPGDVARVTLRSIKKRYAVGELKELTQQAADRTVPQCSHYGHCGGCELQHLVYAGEVRRKEEMVLSSFQRQGIVHPLLEPTVSGPPYGYRRRIKLHLTLAGALGYHRRGSNHVVLVQECPVAEEPIEHVLKELAGDLIPQGYDGTLMLETDGQKVVASCTIRKKTARTFSALKAFLQKHFVHYELLFRGERVKKQGVLTLLLPSDQGNSFHAPAGAFSQGNWGVNTELVAYVGAYAEASVENGRVADLYGGAGNFGLVLARRGFSVVSVELSQKLSQAAQRYALHEGFNDRFTAVHADVSTFLQQNTDSFDLAIADPPREGLKEIVPFLPQTGRLLAIFCELPSAVRDVKALVERGWCVERMKIFDMFPQTSRVELVVALTSRDL